MKRNNYFWILAFFLLIGLTLESFAQDKTSHLKNFVLASVSYHTEQELPGLESKYDIWHIDQANKKILVLLEKKRAEALMLAGLEITVEQEKTDLLHSLNFPLDGYKIVEEIYTELFALAAQYTDLVEVIDYGDSWEKVTPNGWQGYDLYAMIITNKNNPAPKPPIVIDGGIHAREMTPPEVVLEYAHYLLDNYNIEPDISWLIDYREIHIIPMLNPDGRKKAEQGLWWRKNTNNLDGCTDSTLWGVDLNRNFTFEWIGPGSSTDPSSQTFRGSAPASEPEISFYLDYVRTVIPDQRGPENWEMAPDSTIGIYLNCHSYGNVVLHPWGFTSSSPPNLDLITIAEKMGQLSGYGYQASLYPVNGVARDWGYGELGCPSYTVEMGEEFFQPYEDVPAIAEENIRMFFYLTKITDHPYLSIHGPEVNYLQLSEPEVEQGDTVNITALISDYTHGDEVVAAAELYLVPVGDTLFQTATASNGLIMQLSDSVASSVEEQFELNLVTSNDEAGKYYIFARGQDINGNWGPFTAQYLTIKSCSGISKNIPSILPETHSLIQNYPNPFNEQTTIDIALTSDFSIEKNVYISIYNIMGQLIEKRLLNQIKDNTFRFSWPNKTVDIFPGIYFVVIQSGDLRLMHKLVRID